VGAKFERQELPRMAKIDETRPFIPVRIAVLTMSDTRSLSEDKSGSTLAEMIAEAGHVLADRALVKDDVAAIRARVQGWIDDPAIDVVITTGGTGFTGRDVTPEAVTPLFEKHIDGFSAIFHMLSYQKIETSTIQSRACGGVARGTYIFCLPGSTGACKDAWNGILKWQLDNRHRPCNFVEIMPRLEEHRRGG
jgi:molybdenum cofactor biosynthesis protein B